jgi:hypothetical protein
MSQYANLLFATLKLLYCGNSLKEVGISIFVFVEDRTAYFILREMRSMSTAKFTLVTITSYLTTLATCGVAADKLCFHLREMRR